MKAIVPNTELLYGVIVAVIIEPGVDKQVFCQIIAALYSGQYPLVVRINIVQGTSNA